MRNVWCLVISCSAWSRSRYHCTECWTSDHLDICRTMQHRCTLARSVASCTPSCSVYKCGIHWRPPITNVTAPFSTLTSPKMGRFCCVFPAILSLWLDDRKGIWPMKTTHAIILRGSCGKQRKNEGGGLASPGLPGSWSFKCLCCLFNLPLLTSIRCRWRWQRMG